MKEGRYTGSKDQFYLNLAQIMLAQRVATDKRELREAAFRVPGIVAVNFLPCFFV